MPNESNNDFFEKLADSWPSEIVARKEVGKFTGGLIGPKTMANLDCRGDGPQGKITFGRNVGYQKSLFVQWLRGRATAERG